MTLLQITEVSGHNIHLEWMMKYKHSEVSVWIHSSWQKKCWMLTEKMEGPTSLKMEQAWMAYTPDDDDDTKTGNFGLGKYLEKAVLTI